MATVQRRTVDNELKIAVDAYINQINTTRGQIETHNEALKKKFTGPLGRFRSLADHGNLDAVIK
jgi:hypothetical protein